MYCVRKMTEDLYWVGASERRLNLFENAYPLTNGVSYNSYLLLDEKTVLIDTVDKSVSGLFFENVDHVHEKSGNMEAGAYGLRAVLVLLRLAPAAAVGRPHPVRDRAQCGDDRVCRVDHRIPPARPDALRAPGHGTRAAEKV